MENIGLQHLWELCKKQDRKAQAKFYNHLSKKMFTVCLRYADNYMEAEDILQTGFIKVFTKQEYYRGIGSLEGWVRKIIVNTAIEFHRKKKIDFTEEIDDRSIHITSPYSADSLSHYNELLAMVQLLPTGYRTVFNMYAIEGYTHKEISEILDITEGSSKSQLSRARNWLKQKLTKQLNKTK